MPDNSLSAAFFSTGLVNPVVVRSIDHAGPCILAVSGGQDSMLLLHLFRELWNEGQLHYQPIVFHLNHGLRDSAEADLEFVARESRRLDFPFYFAERNVATFARRTGSSLEEAGRRVRYRALGRLRTARNSNGWIVTAHHADDYLESVLMHLIRGGGPGAMNTLAFFSRVEDVPVVRPLLGFTRARITELIAAHGISFVEDPSNQSDQFLRNRLRRGAVAALRSEGLDPIKLWRNFHEDPRDSHAIGEATESPRLDRDLPGFLSIDRRLVPDLRQGIAEFKQLLDAGFRRLRLPPVDRNLLEELRTQWLRSSDFRFSYSGRGFRIWSDRRGPLWIFRTDAGVLRPPRWTAVPAAESGQNVVQEITYNGRTRSYPLRPSESAAVFRAGLRVRLVDGSHVPVRKLLREAGIPEPVREFLPIIVHSHLDQEPSPASQAEPKPRRQSAQLVTVICFGFWEYLRDRRFNLT